LSSALKAPFAYGLAAALALAELVVLWLALHPAAAPDYTAYYITHTVTCLNQPFPGTYALGETLSFRSEGYGPAKDVRVCGWEGPAGDGTHAVGTTSRLRFALPPHVGRLVLTLAMTAVEHDGHPRQRIDITGNGVALGEIVLAGGETESVDLAVPAEAVEAAPNVLDVILSYPDAIRMAPGDADTRLRSIKLLSARLGPPEYRDPEL
jgi:hypothetical protein